jgi:hypothetical protein
LPVIGGFGDAATRCDGALLTDLKNSTATLAKMTEQFGSERVFVPAVLTGRMRRAAGDAKRVEAAS